MTQEHDMPKRRNRVWVPFLLGLPLAGLAWLVVFQTPLADTEIKRYFVHPVEAVEIVMFSVAMGAFLAKILDLWRERKSFQVDLLPPWDGKPVEVSEAPVLFDQFLQKPPSIKDSWLGRRIAAALEYLTQRKSTDGFDDQLRSLADMDAFALDSSYGLTRFITWAIPILGFLGTVLGITGAISGVTPEVLENSLGTVTDGLALAFDTTALALGLTMVTMFVSFLVEKAESRLLESVDRFAETQLSHRFLRSASPTPNHDLSPEGLDRLCRSLETAGSALSQMAQRYAHEMREQHVAMAEEFRNQGAAALAGMLQTVQSEWIQRLTQLDERQLERWRQTEAQTAGATRDMLKGFEEITGKLGQQIREIQGLGQSAQHLAQMQHLMHQNLASLASVGSFDQAMHSLIGAIHLLTARAPLIGSQGANLSAHAGHSLELGHGPDQMRGPLSSKPQGQHAA